MLRTSFRVGVTSIAMRLFPGYAEVVGALVRLLAQRQHFFRWRE